MALLGGCTIVRGPSAHAPPRSLPATQELAYTPLDPAAVRVEREGLTVERSFILSLYTWLHDRDYGSFRVSFDGNGGVEARAHMLLPPGRGPRAGVLVFDILAGSHVVSEAIAKAFVNHGFAVLRLERRDLDLDEAEDFTEPSRALRASLLDARAILEWFAARPDVDEERLAVAGVSLGGILAATLLGVEPRLRAGVLILAGGGVAEILYDSSERPVRALRDRIVKRRGLASRQEFLTHVRPSTLAIDPLSYAHRVEPRSVLLVSARFDTVVRRPHTRALWEALGRPTWVRVPVGHYQILPFFWWALGQGAEHLDRALRTGSPPPLQERAAASEKTR